MRKTTKHLSKIRWGSPVFFISLLVIGSSYLFADWQINILDSQGDVGRYSSVKIDALNNIHNSYYDSTNGDLKYAKWTGTSWSIQTIDSVGDVGRYTSLALDKTGNPHISYYDFTNKDLKYAKWTGTSWSTQTIDSAGDVGQYTSIALDTTGYPHISYYDFTNRDLKYAKWTGTSWSTQTIDSDGDVGWNTSIALDTINYPHISYCDCTNWDLKYAKWTGTSWSTQTIDSQDMVGEYTSIALNKNNNPHISYFDHFSNLDLKYAKWTGTSWSTQTVESAGDVGSDTSISLDSSGNPHISYFDWANTALKYAKWTGTSWSTQTIDSPGDVGRYTSLALDKNNSPHISYYDFTNRDLKFVIWTNNPNLSWTGETNYLTDGLNPETGTSATTFIYRIKYFDPDNNAPASGYLKVHIKKSGIEILGSPFVMNEIDPGDTIYSDGKIFSYTRTLSAGTDYTYYFEAYDIWNSSAAGNPINAVDAPDVSAAESVETKVEVGQIKIVATEGSGERGTINPDKGGKAKIYFKGTEEGKYTCRIFTLIGELIYEETKQSMAEGQFEWAPKNIASGIYLAHVEGPGIRIQKKLAILR